MNEPIAIKEEDIPEEKCLCNEGIWDGDTFDSGCKINHTEEK